MITVLYFGQIQSITSLAREEMNIASNLGELKMTLLKKIPELINAHFVFSVNQKITDDCELKEHDEVALLPPFSGG